jgi:DNA-binding NarL/FixJ family response regulator
VHPAATRRLTPDDALAGLVDRFSGLHRLSPQQATLLTFAVSGICRKQAAARLGSSLKTVEEHWRRIYAKVGCASESEVIARFLRFVIGVRAAPR